MQLHGLHHLTAITSDAPSNRRFYTETLGMRMVKMTVNQDDTSAYHLFYADGKGSPGTDITFFDWSMGPEARGTRSVIRTGLRVPEASLDFWAARLREAGATIGAPDLRDGRAGLDVEDGEGQRLRLVADDGSGPFQAWQDGPVPAEHQVRGLGPVVLSVPVLERTDRVLQEVMNMTRARDYAGADGKTAVHVYQMGEGGAASELHVAVEPDLPPARQGAGAVHHVAFRTPDAQGITDWCIRLDGFGIPNSGEVERYYFRSLYFREPAGILFEIATDGPGFAVDEPEDKMGERLALPPFLEPKRAEIEAGLTPLD